MANKEQYVVYDLVNNVAYVSYGKNKFGKTYKFKTQKQAYAKARELSFKTGYPIYDKLYGRLVKPKKAKRRTRAKRTSTPRSGFGFDGLF